MFYAHVSTPLSTVHCRVHTFLLIFLHPLLSVRGSHAEVTFDKRFLSTIYLFIIKVCPHKPQATIRLTFHREIAGILCCHAIVPANATITNIRRSISPPFCFQEKKIIAPIMLVHPFSLPPRFGRIKEHEIEYLTHTTDPEIDFGHQMAPLETNLNFTSVCTTSWTDSLSDIGTHRSDPRFTWVQ